MPYSLHHCNSSVSIAKVLVVLVVIWFFLFSLNPSQVVHCFVVENIAASIQSKKQSNTIYDGYHVASHQEKKRKVILATNKALKSKNDDNDSLAFDTASNPTLYDTLRASPHDSSEVLKKKYNALARQLHPDANIDIEKTLNETDFESGSLLAKTKKQKKEEEVEKFSAVVAAYRTLSDPKERLRYDRSLKAKEIAHSFETFIEDGITGTVLPFLRKTANTTASAVEQSSKGIQNALELSKSMNITTIQGVSSQMKIAKQRFELVKQIRDLEEQASKELTLAYEIKNQLDTVSDIRVQSLSVPNSDLSSTDAYQILERFDSLLHVVNNNDSNNLQQYPTLMKDIELLEEMEKEYENKVSRDNEIDNEIKCAEFNLDNAINVEKYIANQITNAQKEVLNASNDVNQFTKNHNELLNKIKITEKDLHKYFAMLNSKKEKVRDTLKERQDKYLQNEHIYLKNEYKRLRSVSEALLQQVDALNLVENEDDNVPLQQEIEKLCNALKNRIDTVFIRNTFLALQDTDRDIASTDAFQMLERFNTLSHVVNEKNSNTISTHKRTTLVVTKDIDLLSKLEEECEDKVNTDRELQSELQSAKSSMDNAISIENIATEKLQDFQNDLIDAKNNIKTCRLILKEATNKKANILKEINSYEILLKKQKEKTRIGLRQKENKSIQNESIYLKKEYKRWVLSGQTLLKEVDKLKSASEKLKLVIENNQ